MGWVYAVLLSGAVLVLAGAEWPRLSARVGLGGRRRLRPRPRSRANLRVVSTPEDEEFAASVERDLQSLPTIDERNGGS